MTRSFSRERLLESARRFRREPSHAEARAWEILRDARCLGFKFRRQHPIRGFLADFYCARLRLVIEVDGPAHDTPEYQAYDRARDQCFVALGLVVARLSTAAISVGELRSLVAAVAGIRGLSPPLHERGEGAGG